MIAHKLRFYPDSAQEALLARMFGSARWVWNSCLAWRTAAYKLDGESVTGVDFSRELTWLKTLDCYAWLKDTPATVYAQVLRDQDKAFANFFAGRAKYPKFKKRRVEQAIRMQMDQRTVMNCYRDGELLKIPGLGPVDVRWTRPINGIPKAVTVRRTAAGRYFVSFMVETTMATLPQRTNAVGIDMGLGDVIVTSDGVKSGRSRHFKRKEKALGRAQRRLSRKVKGSNRRRRAAREVARIHAKVADSRADYLHKLRRRSPGQPGDRHRGLVGERDGARDAEQERRRCWPGRTAPATGVQSQLVRARSGGYRPLGANQQGLFGVRGESGSDAARCAQLDVCGLRDES